jgi:hypothetical protein
MALVQAKGRLESAFNGWLSSGVATTANGAASHQVWLGARRNMVLGFDDRKAAIPNGHLAPSAWFLPQVAGGMSSVNEAKVTFTASGNAAQGYNRTGAVAFIFAAAASGAAVASASGDAAFAFTGLGVAVAPINADGSATITFSASGDAGADATITGAASISFTADLETQALGFMVAVPLVQEVTADSIAEAVMASLVEPGLDVTEALRLISAALAGKVSGAGTTTVTIRDVADTKDRIIATVDSSGNRSAITTDAT